ncbi:hypothetical protein TNCV_3111991 [Trichonephila clavipes]|nr:hypothetical protein TNCV_3111991 [Trichonephila clavipes]
MIPNLYIHVLFLFLSWLERIVILAPKNPTRTRTISGNRDKAPSELNLQSENSDALTNDSSNEEIPVNNLLEFSSDSEKDV